MECPTCNTPYRDMLDHIRKRHTFVQYTTLQLQPLGLTPCPECHTACRGIHGVRTHQAKVHHIPGGSTTSTPRRIVDFFQSPSAPPLPTLKSTISPDAVHALEENASYLGRTWLGVLPTQKTRIFADPETTEALRSRLLLPIRPPNSPCGSCGAIAALGHQDTCRAALRRWSSRHE